MALPVLSAQQQIVDVKTGKPTSQFKRFSDETRQGIIDANLVQDATIAALAAIVAALQATTGVAQAAQQAANEAQATADAAGGGTATSGSNTALVTPEAAGWYPGPQVDLTGVSAGDLTITGSGPLQSDSTTSVAAISGEFRVVEIISMVETTLFTGNFSMTSGTPPTVTNLSTAAVAAFTSARASTGAVSYRLDAQRTDGGVATTPIELELYLFVRRA